MGVFLRRKSGQQRAQPLRLAQEQQLFLTREPLDGVLHPRRGCEIRRAPQPLERFDGMAAGVFGAGGGFFGVLAQTAADGARDAGIETAPAAADDVDVSARHAASPPLVWFCLVYHAGVGGARWLNRLMMSPKAAYQSLHKQTEPPDLGGSACLTGTYSIPVTL